MKSFVSTVALIGVAAAVSLDHEGNIAVRNTIRARQPRARQVVQPRPAPVMEAPVMEAPVMEAPVMEAPAPVMEAPVMEAPAPMMQAPRVQAPRPAPTPLVRAPEPAPMMEAPAMEEAPEMMGAAMARPQRILNRHYADGYGYDFGTYDPYLKRRNAYRAYRPSYRRSSYGGWGGYGDCKSCGYGECRDCEYQQPAKVQTYRKDYGVRSYGGYRKPFNGWMAESHPNMRLLGLIGRQPSYDVNTWELASCIDEDWGDKYEEPKEETYSACGQCKEYCECAGEGCGCSAEKKADYADDCKSCKGGYGYGVPSQIPERTEKGQRRAWWQPTTTVHPGAYRARYTAAPAYADARRWGYGRGY